MYIIVDFLLARSTKPSTNARGLNDLLAHSPGFENDMPEQMLSTIVDGLVDLANKKSTILYMKKKKHRRKI